MKRILRWAEKHRRILLYLVVGVLTTAVSWGVYFPLYNLCTLPAAVCTAIGWAASVVFAFVTNKIYVFQRRDWTLPVLLPEVWKFFTARLLSGIFDVLAMGLAVDMLGLNGNVMRVTVSAVVVFVNYFVSRYMVFKS